MTTLNRRWLVAWTSCVRWDIWTTVIVSCFQVIKFTIKRWNPRQSIILLFGTLKGKTLFGGDQRVFWRVALISEDFRISWKHFRSIIVSLSKVMIEWNHFRCKQKGLSLKMMGESFILTIVSLMAYQFNSRPHTCRFKQCLVFSELDYYRIFSALPWDSLTRWQHAQESRYSFSLTFSKNPKIMRNGMIRNATHFKSSM